MEEQQHLFDLQIDPASQLSLAQTAKWGKFISIVGFVMIGLMAIFSFSIGTILSTLGSTVSPYSAMGALPGFMFTIIYLGAAAIMFVPTLFLFQFSVRMKKALDSNDQELLARAFESHKSMYKFYGIVLIICLSFYALILIPAIFISLARR